MSPTARTLRDLRADGWTADVVERVHRRIVVQDDGHWGGLGTVDRSTGYRRLKPSSYQGEHYAHRVVYRLYVGPIPSGLQIDHLCRVRSCINPDHLEVVTSAENSRRSPIMGEVYRLRRKWTHCLRGHEFTPANTYVDKRGFRQCKTCKAEGQRRRRVQGRAS